MSPLFTVYGGLALIAFAMFAPVATLVLAGRIGGVPRKMGLLAAIRFWQTPFGSAAFWISLVLCLMPMVGIEIFLDAVTGGVSRTDRERIVYHTMPLLAVLSVATATVATFFLRRVRLEDAARWLEEQHRKARSVEEGGR